MVSKANKSREKAIKHFTSGQWTKALQNARKAVQLNPEDRESCRLLALCYLKTKHLKEAEHTIQRVLQKFPVDVPALLNSASIAQAAGKWPFARQQLQKALKIDPKNPVAYFNLGNAWVADAFLAEAADAYSHAIQLKPSYWQAWLNLGHVQKSCGNVDEAGNSYRQAVRYQPRAAAAYLGLANLKGDFLTASEAERLHNIHVHPDNIRQRMEAGFALGEYYHCQSEFDAAANYWKQANDDAWQQLSPYQKKQCVPKTEELKRIDLAKLNGLWQQRQSLTDDNPPSRPVFVVGMPRSGTTLIEQILASHTQVTGASELPFVPQIISSVMKTESVSTPMALLDQLSAQAWQHYGMVYLQETQRWQQKQLFVDKLPENVEHIGHILMMMPQAQIIVCQRDPLAIALSNFRQHYASGRHWSYSLPAIFQYWHYQQEILALWSKLFPDNIHQVCYESLIENLPSEVEKMNRFLRLTGEDAQLTPHLTQREIRTASAGQVTEPVYRSSLALWENYDRCLNLSGHQATVAENNS